ncbi:DUF427 domain-containing protein [Jiangella mangrovi]|uniref:Uncharacterized protein (DUF427 family) n=1 Tax=Jiangella mangrovi TaxID=1524084 RepID=A0A7W9GRS9_9ACTN|nr:DUF427 domain-containing protein [Jiangella mangrovi]MBB5788541.1 uncharacterized protein (DUF427 family) [Jiangella mangrovi]
MGLSWQQGPLATRGVGTFLTDAPLPERLLFAEPLRRRMRVRFQGEWIADSEDVVLLHEPGHYPVAYFPLTDIRSDALQHTDRVTNHRELGATAWFTVTAGGEHAERAAWQHVELPGHADVLAGRVAFAWRQMDAFYEEDERILGHAADAYHRIDVRRTSRHLVVEHGDTVIADTHAPVVLYESGFAPRWYVTRDDIVLDRLTPLEGQTFCPYKGLASYYAVDGVERAAWSYENAFTEVGRVDTLISFEPDLVEVYLDGVRQQLAPGQLVTAHGLDRGLDPDEVADRTPSAR